MFDKRKWLKEWEAEVQRLVAAHSSFSGPITMSHHGISHPEYFAACDTAAGPGSAYCVSGHMKEDGSIFIDDCSKIEAALPPEVLDQIKQWRSHKEREKQAEAMEPPVAEDFDNAAEHVFKEHEELLERLASRPPVQPADSPYYCVIECETSCGRVRYEYNFSTFDEMMRFHHVSQDRLQPSSQPFANSNNSSNQATRNNRPGANTGL